MPLLYLHKTTQKPGLGTVEENALYMESTPGTPVARKAWRIKVPLDGTATEWSLAGLSVIIGQDTDGTAFEDASSDPAEGGDKLFDGLTGTRWQWMADTLETHNYAGKIYDIPVVWTQIDILSGTHNVPQAFTIEYSDDTTTGIDGTWVVMYERTGGDIWAPSTTLTVDIAPLENHLDLHMSGNVAEELYETPSYKATQQLLAESIMDGHSLEVADITARDALMPAENGYVVVLDASDDPAVGSGIALYEYDKSDDAYLLMYSGTTGLAITDSEW